MKLVGTAASGGRGCAPVLVHLPHVALAATATAEGFAETLERALSDARTELASVIERARERLSDAEAAIFEVQAAMLDDPEWIDPIRARVAAGEAPQLAVMQVTEKSAAEIAALPDEYLRERAADIRDVGGRVMRLLGEVAPSLQERIGSRDVVVAAHDLTPSEVLALDPACVRAVIVEAGGRTSHMAILARQLGIPAVVGVAGLMTTVRDDVLAAVDGDAGIVELEPPEPVARSFATEPSRTAPVHADPVATSDGVLVEVLANAASAADVRRAVAMGADGIGLYRTEFLFLERSELPGEDDQAQIYAEAAEAADGRPIVFRTLDIGGDKNLPSLPAAREENPFLGVRGIRFSLVHAEIFDTQLRALAAASRRHRNIAVMLPMITEIDEIDTVRRHLASFGAAESHFPLGAMIEVPAAALLAAELAATTDFLSVGTNDLTQYLLAVDRGSEALTYLYNELHPAVLRMLWSVAAATEPAGRSLSVCGDLAGRPGAARLLLGLGYRRLSVVAPQVQTVKRELAKQSAAEASDLVTSVLAARRTADVEQLLRG